MVRPMDELIPTRATLIHRLKNWQDQSSWQDFFDTYWKLIFTVAIQAGLTEVEAQDVVQETMVSVARHMPSFTYDRDRGSFKTWLLNMTRWRIKDQFRRRESLAERRRFPEETATGTRTEDKEPDPSTEDLDPQWHTQSDKNILEPALTHTKPPLTPHKHP